jgi:hypothetical protein
MTITGTRVGQIDFPLLAHEIEKVRIDMFAGGFLDELH